MKKEIENLIKNLTFQSETDAPLELVDAEQVDFFEFFELLVTTQAWDGFDAAKAAQQYLTLRDYLDTHLTDLKVYKFGKTEKEVFIIGADSNGKLVALKTEAVET